jgi:hypothetical protein
MYLTPSSGSRYSMPAHAMKSQQRSSVPTHSGLGPLNTTSFLFDDNDDKQMSAGSQAGVSSPNATTFLQMTPNDDNFPTLRSDRTSGIVSWLKFSCADTMLILFVSFPQTLQLSILPTPDLRIQRLGLHSLGRVQTIRACLRQV